MFSACAWPRPTDYSICCTQMQERTRNEYSRGRCEPRAQVHEIWHANCHERAQCGGVLHSIHVEDFIARIETGNCAVESDDNMMPDTVRRGVPSSRWRRDERIGTRAEVIVATPVLQGTRTVGNVELMV